MNKKRLVIIISAAVVVVIGIVVMLVWMITANQAAQEQAQKAKKDTPQYTNKQQLIDEINKKYGTKDYEGAIELIEQQNSVADPGTQLLLAGAYATSGNVQKSTEIYKKLDQSGNLAKNEYANAAETAERAKDYKTALDYYKKAKENAMSSNTETIDQLAVYDSKIAEMEKKQ